MSKKIVVITGSPRKKGNSFALTEAFIEEAGKKGHKIERFDAAMMNINGCKACETCFKTGKACSFDDDFNKIAPSIEDADAIVFTMPLYWYNMPAQIKAVFDKLFSFMVANKDIAGKECALIACCEENDVSAMESLLLSYKKSIELLKWTSVDEILVTGVRDIGDIEKTDGCEKAAALADKF